MKYRFDRTVTTVADPAREAEGGGLLLGPAPEPDALDPAGNDYVDGGLGQGGLRVLRELHDDLVDHQAFAGLGLDGGDGDVALGT